MVNRIRHFDASFWRAGALAGVCYAVHFGAWVWSLNLTSVAASVTLVTATPIMLGLLGWISGQDAPGVHLWAALSLAVLGVFLIGFDASGPSETSWVGDALALLGAAGMAGYLLVGRGCGPGTALPLITVAATVGACLLLGTALIVGIPIETASSTSLFWIVMAALIPQLIGHTCLTMALEDASPTSVAMSTVAEPVGAATLAWFFLAESVSAIVVCGCICTLLAVLISLRGQTQPDETQTSADRPIT